MIGSMVDKKENGETCVFFRWGKVSIK